LDGGLNTYGYALQNPINFIDPTGQNALVYRLLEPVGVAIGVAAACASDPDLSNEILNQVAQDLSDLLGPYFNAEDDSDSAIDDLIDGLEPELDKRGRPRPGNFIDPEGNPEEALGRLPGVSDGQGGKILPDGSRAGLHTSTGRSGGRIGQRTGRPTLHINRPGGKQNIKVGF